MIAFSDNDFTACPIIQGKIMHTDVFLPELLHMNGCFPELKSPYSYLIFYSLKKNANPFFNTV